MSVPAEVLADDTDVFFPQNAVSGTGEAPPNILFVIDDSGSMVTNKDGTGLTRLQRVKNAFGLLMDGISANTNAGLARFSYAEGGPIVFPVQNVEKLIKDVDPVNLATFTDIAQPLVSSTGDFDEAEQLDKVGTTATLLSDAGIGSPLHFGFHGTTTDFLPSQEAVQCASSAPSTFSASAGSLIFDNGNTKLDGSGGNGVTKDPLFLIYGKGTCGNTNKDTWTGFRFANLSASAGPVGLPVDAVVTDARLVFTAYDNDGLHRQIRVYGQKNNADSADGTGSGHNTIFGTDDTLAGSSAPNAVSSATAATNFNSKRLPTNGSRTTSTAGSGNSATPTFLNATFPGYVDTNLVPLDATDDQPYTTSNLADVINEVKWCKNGTTNPTNGICTNNWSTTADSVNFLITAAAHGTGTHSIRSMNSTASVDANGNNNNGYDPKLEVAYTSATAAQAPPQIITAIRFENIQIPKGATLTSAFLIFNQDAIGGNAASLPINMSIELADDAAPLAATDNLRAGGTRSWSASQPYTFPTWNAPFTAINTSSSNSVKTLLQQVINRPPNASNIGGWCGGQSVVFKFDVTDATAVAAKAFRRAISAAQNDSGGPQLVYSYASDDAALANGCFGKQPTSSTIGAGSDDASQNSTVAGAAGGTVTTTATTLNLGCATGTTCQADLAGTKNNVIGLRFAHISVPQGATITSATLSMTASTAQSSAAALNIRVQNIANAPAFSNGSKGDLRDRYNAATGTVTWTPPSFTGNTTYSTPDLTSIVQPIISNAGWVLENSAMVFLITGTGTRTVYSIEGSAGNPPQLNITYKSVSGRLTVRNYLKLLVNQFTAPSNTPSVGTLYEAARYLRGEGAYYGLTRGFRNDTTFGISGPNSATGGLLAVSAPSTFINNSGHNLTNDTTNFDCQTTGLTDASCAHEYYSGSPVYKTPITDACQQNSLVFLTDGGPNRNDRAVEQIHLLPSFPAATCFDTGITVSASSSGSSGSGACGPELANYLFTNDQSTATVGNNLAGAQHISTYAIQFAVGSPASDYTGTANGPNAPDTGVTAVPASNWLKRLAGWTGNWDPVTHDPLIAPPLGRGAYYAATDSATLLTAFQSIVSSIRAVNTTFVSPAVTVNTYNRLTNRNELYFALFRPDLGVNWPGNLKRYQLLQQTGDSSPQVYDQAGAKAVDPATGLFTAASCSYWTPTCPDGPDVTKGGAASKEIVPRNVYSNLSGGSVLSSGGNLVNSTNVTLADLGLNTGDDPTLLFKWISGYDTSPGADSNLTRKEVGDPLHSEPTLVAYGGNSATDTTDLTGISIYYGDNHGYLHNVNATDGNERWSFIPRELLSNPNTYFQGGGSYINRQYGLDGPITTFVRYPTAADNAAPSLAYLYAGMRRGGNSYYGLNITNRDAPSLAFLIQGGTGSFTELGQTWSKAVVINGRVAGADYSKIGNHPLLIFSGGYDPAQDNKSTLSSSTYDGIGRGVFVVDGLSGALLWSATGSGTVSTTHAVISGMNWSIPAAPLALDLDGDTFVDRIYLADAGGQIIRIVLGKNTTTNKPDFDHATGSVIANLSDTTIAGARRFFNSPDVALVSQGNINQPYLAISIGTGHRETPLATAVQDRFYILRDPDITNDSLVTGYFPITLTIPALPANPDLIDVTADDTSAATLAKVKASKGLFINLGTGEKALTESTTINGKVIFSTFQPNLGGGSVCTASAGQSRFYNISVFDGQPGMEFDTTTTGLTASDRSTLIAVAGLPPDPIVLFPDIHTVTYTDGTTAICNGGNCCSGTNVRSCSDVQCEVFIGTVSVQCEKFGIRKSKWRGG